MAIVSVDKEREEALQFRGLFKTIIELEAVYNPGSVGSNASVQDNLTVPGVELGDMLIGMSLDIDVQDLHITGDVTAADVFTMNLVNATAGAVDLGQCNLHVIIGRPYHTHSS